MATDTKSNEIPAVRTLLGQFDLNDAVVTLDAMHTQIDTATAITGAGGDYVFTVKANMPTLHTKLKELPWKHIPATTATTTGRGRRITRTIKTVEVPDWIPFPGAAQVAQLRRTVTTKGSKTVEVVYLITSAHHTTAPPQRLAAWVQGHWAIENRLHWVRDVTFTEDHSQARTTRDGHLPQHRHQHLAHRRMGQHRRWPTPPRQTPRSRPQTSPDLMRTDYSGALPLTPTPTAAVARP